MEPRPTFSITYPDGDVLPLGSRTAVMGILNVTPDSFSDGGRVLDAEHAADLALDMRRDGADIIDVGGESTRPGAGELTPEQEFERVLPAIEAIRRRCPRRELRISIDTRRAAVARQAVEAGADMINDVSAATDPGMHSVALATGAPLVLMHMRGEPETMQRDTHYDDLLGELRDYLADRAEKAAKAGLGNDKIVVDPGIGFGKSKEGNLSILRQLDVFRSLDRPLLVGASRKAFIGATLGNSTGDRLEGSLAVAALAAWNGAHVIRAHDVAATVRTARMVDAVRGHKRD